MAKILASLEELKLSKREWHTLKFIHDYVKKDPLGRPPSHQELLDHLNTVLPPQPDGRPHLVSKQQTQRIADSLRQKGLLVSDPAVARVARNLALTAHGEKAAMVDGRSIIDRG